jgi:hypothetical protein
VVYVGVGELRGQNAAILLLVSAEVQVIVVDIAVYRSA